jgi:hypothetical protein
MCIERLGRTRRGADAPPRRVRSDRFSRSARGSGGGSSRRPSPPRSFIRHFWTMLPSKDARGRSAFSTTFLSSTTPTTPIPASMREAFAILAELRTRTVGARLRYSERCASSAPSPRRARGAGHRARHARASSWRLAVGGSSIVRWNVRRRRVFDLQGEDDQGRSADRLPGDPSGRRRLAQRVARRSARERSRGAHRGARAGHAEARTASSSAGTTAGTEGARLAMIYELLYPLRHDASWLRWLNVLRYVPFRIIAATMTAMLLSFFVSPWFIRALQRKQIGQVVRDGRPRVAQDQERHADDGRRAHPPLRPRADDPVVRPAQRLRVGHHGGDRGLRRHRLPGRLPQDQGSRTRAACPAATSCSASSSSAARFSATPFSRRSTCRPTGGRSERV